MTNDQKNSKSQTPKLDIGIRGFAKKGFTLRGAWPSGFTLIELLVVIAIIGLLSTLAIVALGTARLKSRDARRMSDLRTLYSALEMYANDNGHYPITTTTIWTCFDCATAGYLNGAVTSPSATNIVSALSPYLGSIPKDPKRTAVSDSGYLYRSDDGVNYKLMALYTPENMNNYPTALRDMVRCGTIDVNGQCSAQNTVGYWFGTGSGY